jgi:hypothetical protein
VSGWRSHRRWFARQILLWGLVAVVLRLVVVPAESCPRVDAAELTGAIDGGAAWLVRGQRGDGRFLYGYRRQEDEVSADYNITRHAGVMDALYRTGHVGAGDAGLRYVRSNLVREDGWSAFAEPGDDAEAGANALLLAALLHRRRATGDVRYDGLARRVARFLAGQQQPDGRILQLWRPSTGSSVPEVYGTYSTGEAFFAIALMNDAFPGERWEARAHRVAGYLATRRDDVEGTAVRQADHWASYGLAELAPTGLTETEAEYARWLAGRFGYYVRYESQYDGRAVGGYARAGASLGTVGEATTALWRAAGVDARLADLRERLAVRSACMAGILTELQVPSTDPNRRAAGAWFADGYTQMDDQQHAIAALLGARETLE